MKTSPNSLTNRLFSLPVHIGITAVLLLSGRSFAQPVVSNVQASQRAGTELVDIYYSVSSPSNSLTVSVSNSVNGGVTYQASTASGAVGNGIAPGSGLHVVWNAGADLAQTNFSDVVVLVAADDHNVLGAVPEPSTIYAGALLLIPLGLTMVRLLHNKKQTGQN